MNELKNNDVLNNEEIDYLVDLIDKDTSVLITAHNQRTLNEDAYNCEKQFLDNLKTKLEKQKR